MNIQHTFVSSLKIITIYFKKERLHSKLLEFTDCKQRGNEANLKTKKFKQ